MFLIHRYTAKNNVGLGYMTQSDIISTLNLHDYRYWLHAAKIGIVDTEPLYICRL
jgi:hypothetical protein